MMCSTQAACYLSQSTLHLNQTFIPIICISKNMSIVILWVSDHSPMMIVENENRASDIIHFSPASSWFELLEPELNTTAPL
jgi:hypothetical protein